MQADKEENCRNSRRACAKMAFVFVVALLVLAGLINFVNGQLLSDLKHNFSLEVIIALVIIINLVSFLCFMVLYTTYRWIRRDFNPSQYDELDE
jgi:uncharacterized BrkB/YihY/UPF0761 family membrane protein